MSATLKIINNFEITIRGVTTSCRQGTDSAASDNDAFEVTVTGNAHSMAGTLATATALKVWDDDTHKPSDFTYLFFKADVDMYIQIVGTATNATFKATIDELVEGDESFRVETPRLSKRLVRIGSLVARNRFAAKHATSLTSSEGFWQSAETAGKVGVLLSSDLFQTLVGQALVARFLHQHDADIAGYGVCRSRE